MHAAPALRSHQQSRVESCRQLLQASERFVPRRIGRVVLPQELQQFWPEADARVQGGIRSSNIRPELNQIFGIAVCRQGLPHLARGILLARSRYSTDQAA